MTHSRTSRRQLFGAGAALLLLVPAAAGAAKADELDGELIRLCAEIPGCKATIDCYNRDSASDAEWEAADGRWDELVEQIIDTPARTPEGIRAKAAALRCSLHRHLRNSTNPDIGLTDHADEEDLLAWSLVHDILGEEPDWS